MTMRENGFKVEEIGVCSKSAQEAALPVLARALVQVIRSRLDNGEYIVEDGLVKLRWEVSDERLSTASRF